MARTCKAQLRFSPRRSDISFENSDSSQSPDDSGSTDASSSEATLLLHVKDEEPIDLTELSRIVTLDLGRPVAVGGSSYVCKGVLKSTGETVAAKILPYSIWTEPEDAIIAAMDEIAAHRAIYEALDATGRKCEYILPLLDSVLGGDFACIITPFMHEGTIADWTRRRYKNGAPTALVYEAIIEIVKGVRHVHSSGFVHRDMKTGNVLVGMTAAGKPRFYISDFGSVASINDKAKLKQGNQGTVGFMASEKVGVAIVKGWYSVSDAMKGDLYGVGIIMYCMLMGIRSPPTGWTPASDSQWEDFLKKLRVEDRRVSRDERVYMGLIRPDFTNRWTTNEFLYRAWPSMPEMQTARPPTTPARKRKRDDPQDAAADARPPPRKPLGTLANGSPPAKKAKGGKEVDKKPKPAPAPSRRGRPSKPA